MNKTKILLSNTTWLYIGKIISQAFGLIISILVIRQLSVEIFGTFNLLTVTVGFVSILTFDPIRDVFFRYIPELYNNNEKNRLKKIVLYGVIIAIIALIIVTLIIFYWFPFFSKCFNIPDFDKYLIPFIIYVLLISSERLLESILSSFLKQKALSYIRITRSILRTTLLIYYLRILDVVILLNIEAFVAAIAFILSLLAVLNTFFHLTVEQQSKKSVIIKKDVLRYGFFSSLNGIGAGIISRTSDFFIVSAMSNTFMTGLYSFANRLYSYIFKILPIVEFYSVLRPLFFQKFSGSYNEEEYNNFYRFIIKSMFPIYLFPAIYFFVFGIPIINYLFEPKYINAYWVTVIVLSSGFITSIFLPLGLVIMHQEKMEIALLSKIIVVFSIFAGILGMKYFGIMGVALATLIGDGLKNIFMYKIIKKRHSVKIYYKLKDFVPFIINSVILILVFRWTEIIIKDIYTLMILSFVFVVSFLFLFIKYAPYNEYDKMLVKKIRHSSKKLNRVIMAIEKFI